MRYAQTQLHTSECVFIADNNFSNKQSEQNK